MNCVFCSWFDSCILSAFKESLCFLHWIYILFFAWNLFLLSVDIIRWNWKIYISFSYVGFGLFWTWNVWVIHVVLSLSLLGAILVFFSMLIFSVIGRKDWFFVSFSVSKRSFIFLSPLLYSKALFNDFLLVLCMIVQNSRSHFHWEETSIFIFVCIRVIFVWKH